MQIFDSHCHLDDEVYSRDLATVIGRARQVDVRAMMVVGLGIESTRRALDIANQHADVYVSVGIHPHDAHFCGDPVLKELRDLASHPKVKAWGETGLDFNRMHSPRMEQETCMARQLEMAAQLGLPLIFHERDSQGRFSQILKAHWREGRKGVVHCFSGDDTELDLYLSMGLYIGITGVLTIQSRGEQLRRQVRRIPLEQLLVETDAPYLTPTPERNKHRRNEPAFVRTVLFKLAEILQVTPHELAQITWNNSLHLFGLDEVLVENPGGSPHDRSEPWST